MPIIWDADRQRELFLAVITATDLKPTGAIWNTVAAQMGGGLTGGAVSQKFYKLKKESEALTAGIAPPSTPSTAPRSRANGTKSTTGKRSRKTAATTNEDREDDTPTKKVKGEPKVKKEDVPATEKEGIAGGENDRGDDAAAAENGGAEDEGDGEIGAADA